jgi:biopolymer transport protein ExbB/biopolymer transport protein TolQ
MVIQELTKLALYGSTGALYLLALLSVFSVTVMLERYLFFRKRRGNAAELLARVERALLEDDLRGTVAALASSRTIEGTVVRDVLTWARGGAAAFSNALESKFAAARKDLERGSNFLGTLGNNAPFIGLFGTVLGVIEAFHHLGDAAQNKGAMGNVMAGIAEALVATGVGLFVAIPAVVAFNVIQKRITEAEAQVASLGKLVIAYVELRESEGRPVDFSRISGTWALAATAEAPAQVPGSEAPMADTSEAEAS